MIALTAIACAVLTKNHLVRMIAPNLPYAAHMSEQDPYATETKDATDSGEHAARLLFVMGDQRGRAFVWALLESAGLYRSSFAPAQEMAFLEGMRNMGLRLLADIQTHCPKQERLMRDEAALKQQFDQQAGL